MSHKKAPPVRRLSALIVGVLLLALAESGFGYPRTLFEREPNDTADQAQSFRGQARLIGELPPGDVDKFLWVLDDAESDRLWTLELTGETDSEILAELLWPAEELEAAVMEFGAQPDETEGEETELVALEITSRRPSRIMRDLLVPPGEHLVRLGRGSGTGDYRLSFTDSGPVRIRGSVNPDDSEPLQVTPGRQWFFQLNVQAHDFDLIPDEEGYLWRVAVLSELGRDVEAVIIDTNGEPIGELAHARPLQHVWGHQRLPEGSRLRVRSNNGQNIGRFGVQVDQEGQELGETLSDHEQDVATSRDEAAWIEPGISFELSLEPRQRRWLGFAVDEALAASSLNIDVEGDAATLATVCLSAAGSRNDVCRSGTGEALFDDMQLPVGSYTLSVGLARRAAPGSVAISLRPGPALPDRHAIEPNDSVGWAAPLRSGQAVEGKLRDQRSAWFDWHLGGEPQLWRIEVDGENITRLELYRVSVRSPVASDSRGQRAPDSGAMQLDDQWLLPGHYRVRVEGEDSSYRLVTTARGQPEPGREREPNDDPETANAMQIGQVMRGSFYSPRDEDHFYLHSPGRNRLVFDLDPPTGGSAQLEVRWGGQRILLTPEIEERTRFTSVVPEGDYRLKLTGSADPADDYALRVDFDHPWSGHDAYPFMPLPWLALPFPGDGVYHKRLGALGSRQEYLALPVTKKDRDIVLRTTTSVRHVQIVDSHDNELDLTASDDEDSYSTTLPGGTQWYLQLRASQSDHEYRIDDEALLATSDPVVEVSLTLMTDRVAAYTPLVQRIGARLELNNEENESLEVPFLVHATHHGWAVEGLSETVVLGPGERQVIDFELIAPPDLPDDAPLTLFLLAASTGASASVAVVPRIEPVGPELASRQAQRFHGLVDLAWGVLGAEFVDPQSDEVVIEHWNGRRVFLQFLNDGMAAGGSSMDWRDMNAALPPLRLAGDGGTVHAFVFNQRSRHDMNSRWREVEIRWGNQPEDFSGSKIVTLEAGDGEQFFALETPVQARYVQLRPLTTWGGQRTTGTGLFRVLGQPDGPLADIQGNLLDEPLGGHWIYSRPAGSTADDFPWGGTQAHRGQRIRGRTIDVAFGFLQHRTARLDRLVWQDSPDHVGELIDKVRIYTSAESPLGPWRDHGEWVLERDEHMRAQLAFIDQPPEARYLRLVFPAPERGDTNVWRIPADIRAYEADSLGSGQSALAYWGMDDQHGPWEPDTQTVLAVEDRGSSPDRPRTLVDRVTAELDEPGDVRSYRIELDEGDNTLSFILDESMPGRLRARLIGPAQAGIELEFRSKEGRQVASAFGLDPGEYRLDVEMPPRSIAILWDGSGSVASHQPAIYRALERFAEGLEPGKEVANLMPLGGPMLIHGWAEYSSEMTATLASYDNTFDSSDSEPALIAASRALERRDGEHVIFLITDAELLGRDLAVWNDLERVRPRIYALEIHHGNRVVIEENRWYQNLMKSWANASDGNYRFAVGRTDLVRGFEAAMREVRQPTRFALEVESAWQAPPEPGYLVVTAGETPVIGAGVVHLIFDASGSMLRRMTGGRRIDVAKRIVREVLAERVPEQVPIALRAYGHTEPHSCETELLVAPSSGNRAAVASAINNIQAINLARTPLAASLNAVIGDLEGYEGQQRLVIMLTDGEETCDGDVEQAVADLIDAGVDIRLNIVGFHIDEIGLQAEFERFAEAGGGFYFDSQDGDQLVDGLAQALAAEFRVINAAGNDVGRGRVDHERIKLEPGNYELIIETSAGDKRRDIRIRPDQVMEIRLSDD